MTRVLATGGRLLGFTMVPLHLSLTILRATEDSNCFSLSKEQEKFEHIYPNSTVTEPPLVGTSLTPKIA